jgi:hypothetical protein
MHEDSRPQTLSERYVPTIVRTVRREYPNHLRHLMTGPDDRPTPREIHPAFYGCYDWHSSVEMHWALVRLLRLAPHAPEAGDIRVVLDEHLTAGALATETAYFVDHPGFERPYGWGWTLMLAHELSIVDDLDARRWSANIGPLADTIAGLFVGWLPRATYPSRDGAHANSAFSRRARCRSPARERRPATAHWSARSTGRHAAGSATTRTTRPTGNRTAPTSCPRRSPRPNS